MGDDHTAAAALSKGEKLRDHRLHAIRRICDRYQDSPLKAIPSPRDYVEFTLKKLNACPHTSPPWIQSPVLVDLVQKVAKYLFYTNRDEILHHVGYDLTRRFAEAINYGDYVKGPGARRTHGITIARRRKEYGAQLKAMALAVVRSRLTDRTIHETQT